VSVSSWHTDKPYVAKLLAVKQTIVTVSKWPSAGGQFQLKINTLSEGLGMSGGFY